jgi:predicted nucleotidyltransferase
MSDVEILGGPPRFTLDAIRRVVTAACRRAGAERAVLFGSYARGDADAYSDVDLLIVIPTQRGFFDRHELFADVIDAFPGSDLLAYTPGEFAELRERGVVYEALREGIVLYPEAAAP